MNSQDCEQPICKESPLGFFRKNLAGLKQAPNHECPLDRQVLGLYSWSLMHTFAIYYPENPTAQDQAAGKGLFEGFKTLYPCNFCKAHFKKDYDRDPPSFENRKDLSLWVCRQHNYVNKILGKSQYPCVYEDLLKRWRTGCDSDEF